MGYLQWEIRCGRCMRFKVGELWWERYNGTIIVDWPICFQSITWSMPANYSCARYNIRELRGNVLYWFVLYHVGKHDHIS